MKLSIPLIVPTLTIVLLALFSCAQEAAEPEVDPIALADISADALWERISNEAPFETYSSWPGEEGIQPGQAPHGPFHRIFLNRTLAQALPSRDRTAPHGAIIVKENMDTSQRVTGFTVMAKVEGYDPEHGDWFWATYGADGSVRAAGALESCIVCHAGMRSNDYVIVYPLDRPLDGE